MLKKLTILAAVLFCAAHVQAQSFDPGGNAAVKENHDAGRVSRMFTLSVASTATAETLITLTYSNALAAPSTCSTCPVTASKTLRIQSVSGSVRNSTGTTAGTATLNIRGAVSGSCTAASPLQGHYMIALPASAVPVLFPTMDMGDGWDIPYGAGACFGVTITHPQWSAGTVVATFDLTIAAYEY